MPRPAAPPRRRLESHDDLGAVAGAEAQEAALRAAATELDRKESALRTTEVRLAQAEAERDRQAAEVGRLSAIAPPPAPPPPPGPPTPQQVTAAPPEDKTLRVSVRGKALSIAIPAAFVTAVAPLAVAAIQHFVALEREIAAMRVAFTGQQERFTALERAMATQAKEAAELRSTVARLSGYLEGALGAAGVKVKAEPGATAVDVQTEGPAPAARRQQVRLATPVPAPKAR